jgi:endonuclease-3
MKTSQQIENIYSQLSVQFPLHWREKPAAKIHNDAYTTLIGVMLSAQSQDARTSQACLQLFALARTPEEMIKLTQDQIIEAIRPAGLYKAKSKNIIATSKLLIEQFDSIVPNTQAELMTLPGVGQKSSDIVMRFVFNEPHIAVDTHVFRLMWRLGWADSLNESKAAVLVNAQTPDKYKMSAHMWLITHAKTFCGRPPRCSECVLSPMCDKRDINVSKKDLKII